MKGCVLVFDKYINNDLNNPTYLFNGSPNEIQVIERRLAHDSNGNIENEDDLDELNDKIKHCIKMLESVGYFIDPELKILTGVFGDPSTKACIHFDSKEIHISQDLELMSNSDLIVALIEENEHYKTGFSDMTRDFQTHLLKLYSNLLLKNVKVLL